MHRFLDHYIVRLLGYRGSIAAPAVFGTGVVTGIDHDLLLLRFAQQRALCAFATSRFFCDKLASLNDEDAVGSGLISRSLGLFVFYCLPPN